MNDRIQVREIGLTLAFSLATRLHVTVSVWVKKSRLCIWRPPCALMTLPAMCLHFYACLHLLSVNRYGLSTSLVTVASPVVPLLIAPSVSI